MVCNVFVTKNRQLEEKWSGRPKTLSTADEQYQKVVLKKYGEKNPAVAWYIYCSPVPHQTWSQWRRASGSLFCGAHTFVKAFLSSNMMTKPVALSLYCISQHPLMRNSEGKISPIQETLGTRLHMHKLESSDIHWVWQHPPGRTPDLFTQNLLLVYKSKLFLYYYKEIFCEICKKSSAAHTKS